MAGRRFEWIEVGRTLRGELRLPLHVVEGARPGPALGLTGLNHGNEPFPTLTILMEVLARLDPAELRGTVYAVPVCNPLAFSERTRHSPVDGLQLNTVFPASLPGETPSGNPTQQLAQVLLRDVLRRLDYLIDFHSGGDTRAVNMIEYTEDEGSRGMARAFGRPILLRDRWTPGQLWTAAAELAGAPVIVAEVGGGPEHAVWHAEGVQGTLNVMRHLGMLPGEAPSLERYVIVSNVPGAHHLHMIRPRFGGALIPNPAITPERFRLGEPVEGRTVLGTVVDPYTLEVLEELRAPFPRTLLLAATLAPSLAEPGSFGFLVSNYDQAEVVAG